MYEDFDREWREGDRAKAKALAQKYVEMTPNVFEKYESLSLEDLVSRIDRARRDGDEPERRRIDMYLLVKREPQRIVGTFAA